MGIFFNWPFVGPTLSRAKGGCPRKVSGNPHPSCAVTSEAPRTSVLFVGTRGFLEIFIVPT